jgi:hypothetical protein
VETNKGHTQPVGGNSQIQWESDQQACIVSESASSKKRFCIKSNGITKITAIEMVEALRHHIR